MGVDQKVFSLHFKIRVSAKCEWQAYACAEHLNCLLSINNPSLLFKVLVSGED